MNVEELVPLLRDPVTRHPLTLADGHVVVPGTDIRYVRRGTYMDFIGDAVVGSSEDHYEEFAFETVNWSDAEARQASVEIELRRLLPTIPKDALVFDVGCGPGRVTVALQELGRQVVAVDLTRRALEILGKRRSITAIRADNLNLPIANEVADWVISTGVVHHTPDPRQAIAENCRILKPGGTLYLRLFNRDGYYRIMYRHLGGLLRGLRRSGPAGAWVANSVFRPLYRIVRRRIGQRKMPDEHLDALFENYFMKSTVTLMSKAEVDGSLATAGMEITDYSVRSTMHCYIAQKKAAGVLY
jgi:SAM-dependent methyltransferase